METGGARELNLFNFDAEENRASRYILTSPRSLRACANLRIKPVQLLPYSLEELAFTSVGVGLGSESLLAIHKECERERIALLHRARKERERLIQEEARGDSPILTKRGRKSPDHSPARRTPTKAATGSGSYCSEDRPLPEPVQQANGSPVSSVSSSRQGHHPSANIKGMDCFSSLPQKDQRIITAMVAKRESEERERLKHLWHDQAWNRQKIREEKERELAEKQRLQELAETKTKFQEKLSKIRKCRHLLEKTEQEALLTHEDTPPTKQEPEATMQAIKDDLLSTERHLEAKHKERLQEVRMSEFCRDQQEDLLTASNSFIERQVRASRNREALSQMQTQETRWKNMKEKMNFEWSRCELEHNQRINRELLKESLERKHFDGLMRYNAEVARRESELQKSAGQRRAREFQRKLRADKSASEMREWQMAVHASCINGLSRAETHLRQQLTERAQNLCNRRTEREREHSENMKRVYQELEQKQQWTNRCLETKNEQTKRIEAQREELTAKSRSTARFSARMREAVKDHYSTNTFDKMVLDGELRAAFEKYGKICTKN